MLLANIIWKQSNIYCIKRKHNLNWSVTKMMVPSWKGVKMSFQSTPVFTKARKPGVLELSLSQMLYIDLKLDGTFTGSYILHNFLNHTLPRNPSYCKSHITVTSILSVLVIRKISVATLWGGLLLQRNIEIWWLIWGCRIYHWSYCMEF